jgi:phage terminase large subunit-like protein
LDALDKRRRDQRYVAYWEPQEQQKQHFKEFTSEVKIFGILGGNRSGKTEEGAFIAVAWALGKDFFLGEPAWEWVQSLPIPDPPNNIWLVGLDFPTLRDVIWREKLRFGRNHPPMFPRDDQIVTKVVDGDYQIFFGNGSIITGKSADSGREKFQGASVDLVWIDEECEADVFDECYQRTADCAGKLLLTLTPLVDIASGVKVPWVFDLYQDQMQGRKDIKFVKLSVLDNPYVPETEKDKLKEKWAGHYEDSGTPRYTLSTRSSPRKNGDVLSQSIQPLPAPRQLSGPQSNRGLTISSSTANTIKTTS